MIVKHKLRRAALLASLVIGDAAALAAAFWAAYYIRFHSGLIPVSKGVPDWIFYRYTLIFSLPLFLFIFYYGDHYKNYFLPAIDDLIRTVKNTTIAMLLATLAVAILRRYEFSRATFFLIWVFASLGIVIFRQTFKLWARYVLRRFYALERIIIAGKDFSSIKPLVKAHPHLDAVYQIAEGPGSLEAVKSLASEKNVSQIILLNLDYPKNELMGFYDWCDIAGVELKVLPDLVQLCLGETIIDTSFGVPMLRLKAVNLSGFNFYVKRCAEVFLASLFLSLAWPFLAVVMLMIKLDSRGPFFYSHKRVGYRGLPFYFYKFRSMVVDADALLEELKKTSERLGPVFKMKNDPRVTNLGRFIRRYSIDEIPQIINVLKGDMSLVGPRPQVIWEAAHYDEWAKRRLRVLPGITGLWQVSGRAALSYEEMIELDIFYIENWSLGLDVKILFKTFFAVMSRHGAY
ncbi:MAG: sugar transferase [Endomicrobiia bacterium]|nr:sugar transferase [Endomicrobiia bacterium]